MDKQPSLYSRLGGYDAIAAVVNDLLPRLMADSTLGRFWRNRGEDGIAREKQLLINYLCANAGGSMIYTGRDNHISHRGMGISEHDWKSFITHLTATLNHFQVPNAESEEVMAFIQGTKSDIVQ
jgi:hemoglobin